MGTAGGGDGRERERERGREGGREGEIERERKRNRKRKREKERERRTHTRTRTRTPHTHIHRVQSGVGPAAGVGIGGWVGGGRVSRCVARCVGWLTGAWVGRWVGGWMRGGLVDAQLVHQWQKWRSAKGLRDGARRVDGAVGGRVGCWTPVSTRWRGAHRLCGRRDTTPGFTVHTLLSSLRQALSQAALFRFVSRPDCQSRRTCTSSLPKDWGRCSFHRVRPWLR